MGDVSMQEKVDAVLRALDAAQLRCTYNALAEYCGTNIGVIIQCLGERRPVASWGVSKDFLKPSHYSLDQEHPHLYRHDRVITTSDELVALLAPDGVVAAPMTTTIPPRDSGLQANKGATCYGVDGCRGGWVYASIANTHVAFGTVIQLTDLVDKVAPGSPIFVDIPIGLRETSGQGRQCDVEGRRLLRPHRTSSIFNAPIRAILDEVEYEFANETSKRLSGKGLSKQTFAITPKIREVDQLMASSAKARGLVREVHPEVCFYGLAGGHPMEHNKKTKEGFQARLDLLCQYLPGAEKSVEGALAHYPRITVAADDILDALVCAITAQMSGHWKTVPDNPETDSKGLAMEMVYCDMSLQSEL